VHKCLQNPSNVDVLHFLKYIVHKDKFTSNLMYSQYALCNLMRLSGAV